MIKTKLNSIVCCAISLLASACSTIEVSEIYDTSYDFARLKTYDWAKVEKTKNELVVKQLRGELKNQLAVKGYKHDAQAPDFLIALHVGTEDKISIYRSGYDCCYGYNYGYHYGYHYGGWYDPGWFDVYEYKEGTLILDIIDAKSKELVFRSTTTTVIDQNISMDKRRKNIQKIISEAITSFPP